MAGIPRVLLAGANVVPLAIRQSTAKIGLAIGRNLSKTTTKHSSSSSVFDLSQTRLPQVKNHHIEQAEKLLSTCEEARIPDEYKQYVPNTPIHLSASGRDYIQGLESASDELIAAVLAADLADLLVPIHDFASALPSPNGKNPILDKLYQRMAYRESLQENCDWRQFSSDNQLIVLLPHVKLLSSFERFNESFPDSQAGLIPCIDPVYSLKNKGCSPDQDTAQTHAIHAAVTPNGIGTHAFVSGYPAGILPTPILPQGYYLKQASKLMSAMPSAVPHWSSTLGHTSPATQEIFRLYMEDALPNLPKAHVHLHYSDQLPSDEEAIQLATETIMGTLTDPRIAGIDVNRATGSNGSPTSGSHTEGRLSSNYTHAHVLSLAWVSGRPITGNSTGDRSVIIHNLARVFAFQETFSPASPDPALKLSSNDIEHACEEVIQAKQDISSHHITQILASAELFPSDVVIHHIKKLHQLGTLKNMSGPEIQESVVSCLANHDAGLLQIF